MERERDGEREMERERWREKDLEREKKSNSCQSLFFFFFSKMFCCLLFWPNSAKVFVSVAKLVGCHDYPPSVKSLNGYWSKSQVVQHWCISMFLTIRNNRHSIPIEMQTCTRLFDLSSTSAKS